MDRKNGKNLHELDLTGQVELCFNVALNRSASQTQTDTAHALRVEWVRLGLDHSRDGDKTEAKESLRKRMLEFLVGIPALDDERNKLKSTPVLKAALAKPALYYGEVLPTPLRLGGHMDHIQLPHYHIRWSGKTKLDWESFSTHKETEANAKQLMRPSETYTIEEHAGTCQRCQDAMNLKSEHGTSKGASA